MFTKKPQNYFISLSSLYVLTEEHESIMDEENRIEDIEFGRCV